MKMYWMDHSHVRACIPATKYIYIFDVGGKDILEIAKSLPEGKQGYFGSGQFTGHFAVQLVPAATNQFFKE